MQRHRSAALALAAALAGCVARGLAQHCLAAVARREVQQRGDDALAAKLGGVVAEEARVPLVVVDMAGVLFIWAILHHLPRLKVACKLSKALLAVTSRAGIGRCWM